MTSSESSQPSPAPIVTAAVLDIAFVTLFAALGRGSHAREASLAGLWHTAWPFLAALAISWALARVWRAPAAPLRSGVAVWIGTVALGLGLRVLFTDGGAALPFVLVTIGMLGVTLVGWRLIGRIVRPSSR